jgi:putative heme-binding domain-containing protein
MVEQGANTYYSNCAICHGQDGAGVEGVDFSRGLFKHVSSDEDIVRTIRNGVPGTAMPKFNLGNQQILSVVAFLRSLTETVTHSSAAGDPVRGKAIVEGKGDCLSCHRVQDKGSRLGPLLTQIGRIRSASMLEQSLLDPDAVVLPEYWFVKAVTRDGTAISGRRLNEDRNTIQIIDTREQLVSLVKDDLRECTVVRTSMMPSYEGKLNAEEIGDVVKYLTTLRGTGAIASGEGATATSQH